MTEQEIISCQIAGFYKYLSRKRYLSCSKQLLNDNGYFKSTEMAEKIGITIKKFYSIHDLVCIRIQFICNFYYKKK